MRGVPIRFAGFALAPLLFMVLPASPGLASRAALPAACVLASPGGAAPTRQSRSLAMPAACPAATRAEAAEGKKVFTGKGNCYTCHGVDAKGTPLAPNLAQPRWINIDGSYAEIAKLVTTGVPHPKQHPAPMPAMGGAQLSADEICDVAAYVYLLSHKE